MANVKYSDVTKIVFSDGRGKTKPFTLDDKQKIDEFMKMLDDYVVKKEKEHEYSTGWIHRADFYKDEKKLMSITFTNRLQIDNKYYDFVKGDLSTKTIDNFIKTINPDWK